MTQTVTLDPYLICFEKDALDHNLPSKKTIMTKDHLIVFKDQWVPAERFLKYSCKVQKVKYTGEVLYNVLMSEHTTMRVNNLECETLHPENCIAKLYKVLQNLKRDEKEKMIGLYNECAIKEDIFTSKKLTK
jgi:hypothetical protein